MGNFIGPELINEIRAANDIVEIIQWLNVPLKKAGTSYRALCPFHKEKTPSFSVSSQRQSFHCFGCGAGGDVFKFVMMREGLEFGEAARRLAERVGLTITTQFKEGHGIGRDEREALYEVHLKARDWFHTNLMRLKQADTARQYLRKRGFTSETAKKFHLGYAPPQWDGLLEWARTQKIEIKLLKEAGLLSEGTRGQYDRFRDRLMIPICDEQGRLVGFSGRILRADTKEAKYVNSPETAIFKKGRLLFGLDRSKRHLQESKTAVICEGQLDWIRCFESGIQNIVAPQGTAFTEEQARILSRYVEEIILCFDSDAAGQKATWRNAEILINANLSVKAVRMPAGEDPDSFIVKFGADAFKNRLAEAIDVFEYKALSLSGSLDMRNPMNHQKVVLEIAPLLNLVVSEPQRQRLIQNICEILQIDVGAFSIEFQRQRRRLQNFNQSQENEQKAEDPIWELGDYFLQLALIDKTAARILADSLQEVWFDQYKLSRVLFFVIRKAQTQNWKSGWDGLDLELEDFEKERIARLLIRPIQINARDLANWLQNAIGHIQKQYLWHESEKSRQLLKNPNLNENQRLQFQRELLDIHRRMKQL